MVETEVQLQPGVCRCQALDPRDLFPNQGRHTIVLTEVADPNIAAVIVLAVAVDEVAVEAHQELDLGQRTVPVLGRERVERQLGDFLLLCGPDDRGDRDFTRRVALDALETTSLRPAAVPIHDRADVETLPARRRARCWRVKLANSS